MKKSFLTLLVVVLVFVFVSGCAKQNDYETIGDPNFPPMNDGGANVAVTIDASYIPFDQVVENCTNVVKGKHLQTVNLGTHDEYIFEVQKQYKGTLQTQQIHVRRMRNTQIYIMDKGYTYYTPDDYVPGQSYILLLKCRRSVYFDYDLFFVQAGTYIPVAKVSQASIYGQPLYEHITLTQKDAKNFVKLENYIARESKYSSSAEIDDEYIQSSKLSDILTQSPYVLRVEPISFVMDREYNYAERYKCKIVATYKGNIELTEIDVDFFADTVEIGNEYIVALTDTVIDYIYHFSAKGSLIPTDQEQEVLAILQKS